MTARTPSPPRPISEHLWVFDDTCQVYVIRHGRRGLLVDLGDGDVLDHLAACAIDGIDWVLITHYHRDQCGGHRKAAARRIPLAVPEHERGYFELAEELRLVAIGPISGGGVSGAVREPALLALSDARVACVLHDREVFLWGPYQIRVLPTPGHTAGSITLMTEIDGQRVGFCGDLMHSDGRLRDLHSLQHRPGGLEGATLTLRSLELLAAYRPGTVCPSHGPPISDPMTAIERLGAALRNWRDIQRGEPAPLADMPWHDRAIDAPVIEPLARRVLAVRGAAAGYAILSEDTTRALLIDAPPPTPDDAGLLAAGRDGAAGPRPLDRLGESLREFGVRSISAVLPTGLGEESVFGLADVAATGAEIWADAEIADVIEHPEQHAVEIPLPRGLTVHRRLVEGDMFEWESARFRLRRLPCGPPGSVGVFVRLDGRHWGFVGRALWGSPTGRPLFGRTTFRGGYRLTGRIETLSVLREELPDQLAPARGDVFPLGVEQLEAARRLAETHSQQLEDLLAKPAELGLDPAWAQFGPRRLRAVRGETFAATLNVRNVWPGAVAVGVRLLTPGEWRVEPPDTRALALPVGATGTWRFEVTIPQTLVATYRVQPIAADVWVDAQHHGAVAEALVEVSDARRL